MLSKFLSVILLVLILSASVMGGEVHRSKDGPFPIRAANGVWQDPQSGEYVSIATGTLSTDKRFVTGTLKIFSSSGQLLAQGNFNHEMKDSKLETVVFDSHNVPMNVEISARLIEKANGSESEQYRLVLSMGYVYEKGHERPSRSFYRK